MTDLCELDRFDENMVNPLGNHIGRQILAGLIRDGNDRHAEAQGLDQEEEFGYAVLRRGLRVAASDKDHLRADLSEFLDCRINGPNEHRLVAMNREPVCELDPKVCILFHNHHTSSRTVLPDRHREISFHVCLSFLSPYGQSACSQTTPCLSPGKV